MKRTIILLLLSITLSANIFAFSPDINGRFQYIGTRNGLPDGQISYLMTDHRGTLWIGTDAGLALYDGSGAVKVADCAVSEICEDSEGNLWIHSSEVILRYLRHEHLIENAEETFFPSIGLDKSQPKFIHTDSAGRLWTLTEKALYCYDFVTRKLRSVTPSRRQWNVMDYYSVAEDNRYIIIGGYGNFLWFVDKETGRTETSTIPSDMTHKRPCIYSDTKGNLWSYSTLSELLYRRIGGGIWEKIELSDNGSSSALTVSNSIHQLADDGKGRLWIATDHRGLFCYNINKGKITQHITSNGEWGGMAENNINALTADQNGNLWLGHYKRGISYSSPGFGMFTRQAKECGDVNTLLCDRNGVMWIGTDGNGLFRSASDGAFEATPLRGMVIASLLQDRRGRVWVGTYGSGLYCIDGGNIKKYSVETGNMPTNMAWKIVEDRHGNIWVCSAFHPLLRLDPKSGRYTYYNNPDGSSVYGLSMTTGKGDNIYVGTSYGVYIVNASTGKRSSHFGNKAGSRKFLNQQIMTLFCDSRGILWTGHNNGMTAWDMKTDSLWYFTTEERGLGNNLVKSIIEDKNGNIWVSSAEGISQIRVADRHKGDFYVTNFKNIGGEYNNYFNRNASTLTVDGKVLFGCVDGYVCTVPQMHRQVKGRKPKVFFSYITANGRPIDDEADEISLRYDDHNIVFRLTTDNPANVAETRYAYRLDSNDEWLYANSPILSFASLAPGSYTMRVKACNSDGVWSDEHTIKIYVAPPLWRSPAMLCLYFIALVAAVIWITVMTKKRNRRKLEREKLEMEQEKNVHIAEMKLRFFTNVSHDLRTPLTLIISPLQTLLHEVLPESVIRRLQIMEKNVKLLQEQINTLLDFRRLDVGAERLVMKTGDIVAFVRDKCEQFSAYAADRNINFSFNADVEKMRMEFDHAKINKIIYNLLSNAFKYTPDGKSIAVTLRRLPEHIEILVADSGPGVADKDKKLIFERFYQSAAYKTDGNRQHITGSGIGLHIVSEYVRLMNGDVTVVDGAGGGAVFVCKLPAKELEELPSEPLPEGVHIVSDNMVTVLIVDDNHDMCEFIGTSLADKYNVLMAANGADALAVLRKEAVSIVVSDIMMPVMDGLELTRRIKTDLQLSHIPVILLTAKTAEDSVMEGYETGADDYLTKPFNIEMLKLRINKFVELARMSHRQFRQQIDVKPSEITITSIDEKFIKRAIEVVEAHLGDSEFSVESLGQELAMNRVALWKKLQAITGKGPSDFIRTIRVKRGRQLLEQSQLTISEIAYTVGYNTVKRFTENFKAEFGMTPSEYKKTIKK